MKSIKFDDSEMELLISMYEAELQEAEDYIVILNKTLSKLRQQSQVVDLKAEKPAKKRGRKPAEKKVAKTEQNIVPAAPKKRGRKSQKAQQEVLNILNSIEQEKSIKKPKVSKAPVVKEAFSEFVNSDIIQTIFF